jgi:tetratricopeptide (TPR) repeat protein
MIEPLILRPDEGILTRYPQLVKLAAELSEIYADREKLVTDKALQGIGTILWRALDADEPFQQARKQAGQHLLPIVIESGKPEILHLPWETLYHPESGFLGRSEGFTLSRAMPSTGAELPAIEDGPLRVLLFTALPDDIGKEEQLRIEDEQALVLEALGQWRQSGHVLLEMPDDGRFSEFTHQLHHFRPHLVYLSGHGNFIKDYLNHNDRGYFLFESDNDGGELVDEERLAAAFTGTTVQAVILSACHSGKASSASLNNGLMQRLADKGIPHVLGMRESILDRAGLQFARAFFGALMQQQSIAASLQQARRAIVRPLHDDEELRHSPLAELSLGQWCLPMLLSYQFDRPLITGRFTPQPMRPANLFNESLNNISLPAHFIGRRRELRRRQRAFREGTSALLMLIGAGGMGKTALAGKLLNTLKADGYEIFAFSARPEHNWRDTVLQMELALDEIRVAKYSKIQQAYAESSKRIEMLLKLLLEQFGSQVALFFDNLESLQDATTRVLTDPELQLWIDAAVRLKAQGVKGLRVVLTSRWALPEWREQLYLLGTPVYRDFLAVAQQQKLPKEFLTDFKRLRQAYEVLGGNYRALEFFAAALQEMNSVEEEQLVASLRKATEEIQTNMLLELVYSHRTAAEQQLLRSLVAYEVPVAFEGVKALVLDELEQPEKALEALLSVSLIERTENKTWQANEFQVSPLVRDWLLQQKGATVSSEQLQRAAGYLQWLLYNERRTVEQAMIAYAALIVADINEEAYRITLDWIVGPMNLAGLYQTLLDTWLQPVCSSTQQRTLAEGLGQIGKQYVHIAQYDTALDYLKRSLAIRQEIGDKSGEGTTLNNISQIFKARGDYDTALDYLKRSLAIQQEIGDKSGEGTTLNNISALYHARGDYDTALDYLKRSLAIRQEIGDNAGLCATLFNMGHIYLQNEEVSNAVSSWVTVYRMAKPMNLAQALQALENLASQLGLPGGLDGWEQLSQQMGEGE